MKITYTTSKITEELAQILVLQQANLYRNVSTEEKLAEGFLTVEHSLELLKEMNDVCPHTIAIDEQGNLAGYAMSMHPSFKDEIAVLKPMFEVIDPLIAPEEKYMLMGQICVSKNHRKQGAFRGLYTHMKNELEHDYDSIITEIDALNSRSMEAHKAVGFEEMVGYHANEQEWVVVRMQL
ncbi:GNAT family N-acetyltransferase [Cellulophaga sp. E16_2]|uniref:GNAT family N-acetyltransferase n=1 Tax=Cellulophaga sp. E16_2 TaxID=2789297 RepID=UPI001A91D392|nr:GNAT family N-acetyltransferase [Cellulophaga sp. E16_2]MBO0590886.1 GNAT family N-acetyltransferase [Cellulophaga sp. E16_2]